MSLGTPRRMKMTCRCPATQKKDRLPPKRLVARSFFTWCHAPVEELDPDIRRHHPLSPASARKQSTQRRRSPDGYPTSLPLLSQVGVTHVAIESTGEYWKPVYNLLEGTFTVFVVNAAHVKNVPGRKTDKADARWLAKLMRYGLLQASFIPPQGQRDLRDLTRYRTKLVQERSREVNRVQGVLERANIKLASVATDIMGVSGRAILEALIAGRADAATMAELARGRMRTKIPVLEQALTGVVREHHRRLLAIQSATSGKAGGLQKVEPLKAVRCWEPLKAVRL
jgi:transposase